MQEKGSILAGIIQIFACLIRCTKMFRCRNERTLAKPLDIEKVKKTICEHTIELYNKE